MDPHTLLRTDDVLTPVVQDDIIYIAVQSYGDSTRTLKHALLSGRHESRQDSLPPAMRRLKNSTSALMHPTRTVTR